MAGRRPDAPIHTTPLVLSATAAALAAFGFLAAGASLAQAQTPIPYKVIDANGRVTYTDRPAPGDSRATPVVAAALASPPAANPPLPLDLRQAVARYPVTLYLTDADCQPCASARQLLRQRGIPYSERQVLSEEDGAALQRLTGSRDLPTLAIGAQLLRGLAPDTWVSYLDAAGYPPNSHLPPGYRYPAATPLVARAPAVSPTAVPSTTANPPDLPNLPNASGIRF